MRPPFPGRHARTGRDRAFLDDGTIGGAITANDEQMILVEVSQTPGSHGAKLRAEKGINSPTRSCAFPRLRQRAYDVFAVNPNADLVEGDPCFHDLMSIPGGVGAVVIGTRRETAEATLRECADLGIKRVWMHRAFGGGSP